MQLGLIFWIMMLLWVLFGVWDWQTGWNRPWGHGVFFFILFLVLGWRVFGAPIHG